MGLGLVFNQPRRRDPTGIRLSGSRASHSSHQIVSRTPLIANGTIGETDAVVKPARSEWRTRLAEVAAVPLSGHIPTEAH
jgi:hypothetical protein